MSIDDLLAKPLIAVRDDGFSASVLKRHRRMELRQRIVVWLLLALGALPALLFLPLAHTGAEALRLTSMIVSSRNFSYVVGALVLLWVWKPRIFRL